MSDSIKSQSEQRTRVTEDFREGHERVFGTPTRKPGRTRYVYTAEGCIEVGEDWQPTVEDDAKTHVAVDLYMDGVRATDGTDIGSRAKRREYMKRNDLVDSSDFTEHWEKAKAQRDRVNSGEADTKERREIIGRALHEAKSRRGKR